MLHQELPRALNWLTVRPDRGRYRVILSLEDDPFSGMPEDIPLVKSSDEVKANYQFRAPEEIDGILWSIAFLICA